MPLAAGGDHLVTLPILRAIARKRPVGIVHFDAHSDTNDSYFGGEKYTHGTPFRRAIEEGLIDGTRFVQIGIRGPMYGEDDFDFHREHGITMIDIDQVKQRGIPWVVEQMRSVLRPEAGSQKPDAGGLKPVYMTFDIDGVDPAFAPGTGTPVPGGLTAREALALVRGLAGLNVIGGKLTDAAVAADQGREWTAPAAALEATPVG